MNTPIVDFLENYSNKDMSRFHMPGHKGHVFFGYEKYDITEVKGADVLHHGDGIIAESQKNATKLFGTGATHYSTEGSTHCIKSMLAILLMENKRRNKNVDRSYILAARNVHRSVIDACALLDIDIEFITDRKSGSICSSIVTGDMLRVALKERRENLLAVYVTTPDYLGQISDIANLVDICKVENTVLVVDNAHGAYLHFMEKPMHPMDLGAAMCCDSAHKTLPVLTGGAYLHISKEYMERFEPYASQALQLMGSTSPSYLIMQSLDACNKYLAENYSHRLLETVEKVERIKSKMRELGINVLHSEKLKIVIDTSGYSGEDVSEELREHMIECEYADNDFVVLMITPENRENDFERLVTWSENTRLIKTIRKTVDDAEIVESVFMAEPERKMTIREAVFSGAVEVLVSEAEGRVCASETIACPPAIPIAVSGEVITKEMIQLFRSYGIEKVQVVL